MKRVITVSIFVLVVCAADASGAAAPRCTNPAGSQRDLTDCAQAQERVAQQRLDRSYRALGCHLEAAEKAQIEASQRAWEAFRNADCEFWAGDGSISPTNKALCRANLANQRARELDEWPPNAPRDALVPC